MKCEFCGADKMDEAPDGASGFFACGTIIWENKHRREAQTIICSMAEVKRLKAYADALVAAGDACAETATTPQQIEWRKAKEAKP